MVLGMLTPCSPRWWPLGWWPEPDSWSCFVSGVDDAAVRAAEVQRHLPLWFFLPQVLFAAASMVAAVCPERDRALGSLCSPRRSTTSWSSAPTCCSAPCGERRRRSTCRRPRSSSRWWAPPGGSAFCAVPGGVGVASRLPPPTGVQLASPGPRSAAVPGSWAAGFWRPQALLVAVLYLGQRPRAARSFTSLAFVLFMLPVSLFAVPVFTTAPST